jgi:hypothetical protein
MLRLKKRDSQRKKPMHKLPEMPLSVRVLASLKLHRMKPSRLTKPRLWNSKVRMHQVTLTSKSSKNSEELTKLPRLLRLTSSERDFRRSFGMPELLMVLMDSEPRLLMPQENNSHWPRRLKSSHKMKKLQIVWELPRPTSFS